MCVIEQSTIPRPLPSSRELGRFHSSALRLKSSAGQEHRRLWRTSAHRSHDRRSEEQRCIRRCDLHHRLSALRRDRQELRRIGSRAAARGYSNRSIPRHRMAPLGDRSSAKQRGHMGNFRHLEADVAVPSRSGHHSSASSISRRATVRFGTRRPSCVRTSRKDVVSGWAVHRADHAVLDGRPTVAQFADAGTPAPLRSGCESGDRMGQPSSGNSDHRRACRSAIRELGLHLIRCQLA